MLLLLLFIQYLVKGHISVTECIPHKIFNFTLNEDILNQLRIKVCKMVTHMSEGKRGKCYFFAHFLFLLNIINIGK